MICCTSSRGMPRDVDSLTNAWLNPGRQGHALDTPLLSSIPRASASPSGVRFGASAGFRARPRGRDPRAWVGDATNVGFSRRPWNLFPRLVVRDGPDRREAYSVCVGQLAGGRSLWLRSDELQRGTSRRFRSACTADHVTPKRAATWCSVRPLL